MVQYLDNKIIDASNFSVVKVCVSVEKTATREVFQRGWAILDKRCNKLVSMKDEYFFCLRLKKHVEKAIVDGLHEGFTHYEGEI